MIEGYLDIPEKLRLKNEIFFGSAKFHGDYKYTWVEHKKILKVYCTRTYVENSEEFKIVLLYKANMKTFKLRLLNHRSFT